MLLVEERVRAKAPGDNDLYPSYYNVSVVEQNGDILLFNGVTSALLRLDQALGEELLGLLGLPRSRRAGQGYDRWAETAEERRIVPDQHSAAAQEIIPQLLDAGIIVRGRPAERDGLAEQYASDRRGAQFLLTITSTLDCNMRCYYCYQSASNLKSMTAETMRQIIDWTKTKLETEGYPALYVDWYGGEPLLNQPVMDMFSDEMTGFCVDRGVKYAASILSNGSLWPQDVGSFVERHRLRHAQFTLDGPRLLHNRRRGTLGPGGKGRIDSYDIIIDAARRLVDHTNLNMRINVDPMVGWSALELLDDFESAGLLSQQRFVPYLAIINAMTEHCGFIKKADQFADFGDEFDRINAEFCSRLAHKRGARILERASQFPSRRRLNCAAVSDNSAIFGPEGLVYKCTLDVGDSFRAHDALEGAAPSRSVAAPPRLDPQRWARYDPFKDGRCGQCQYLPICLGGCPKAHLEDDEDEMIAQCRHWENNIERMLRDYARGGAA